jgi:hypothetical protein
LIKSRPPLYRESHALDYRCNLAHILASRFLVPCWRSLDSHNFGYRRDRGRNQARQRSRGVGVKKLGAAPAQTEGHLIGSWVPPYNANGGAGHGFMGSGKYGSSS